MIYLYFNPLFQHNDKEIWCIVLTSTSSGLYSMAASMALNHAWPIFWFVMIEVRIEFRRMTSMSPHSKWDGLCILLCIGFIANAEVTTRVRSSSVRSDEITPSSSPGPMLKTGT